MFSVYILVLVILLGVFDKSILSRALLGDCQGLLDGIQVFFLLFGHCGVIARWLHGCNSIIGWLLGVLLDGFQGVLYKYVIARLLLECSVQVLCYQGIARWLLGSSRGQLDGFFIPRAFLGGCQMVMLFATALLGGFQRVMGGQQTVSMVFCVVFGVGHWALHY